MNSTRFSQTAFSKTGKIRKYRHILFGCIPLNNARNWRIVSKKHIFDTSIYPTMITQTEFTLRPRSRGCHLITDEITSHLPALPRIGLLHLFIQHTSAALTINENADPDVQTDLGAIFDRMVREREAYYTHTLEGDDDMPAHAKSTIAGVSITIPITRNRLNLGIWQGIYLCEFRNRGGARRIVATIIGE